MSPIHDIFPFTVRDKLFKTERGDVCLFLHEAWSSLLIDLALLGPVFLISRSEQMALMSASRRLNFARVPGTTEMLELGGGACLDTEHLGAVIAGQEAHTGNLSIHFFDFNGWGLLKVVLAPGASFEGFTELVGHYAKDSFSPNPPPALPPLTWCEGAVLREERIHLQKAWSSFDPALGGDFLPGGRGVSWWDALRLAGRDHAVFLTKVGLMKAILGAHHEELRLRVTSWQRGLEHQTTIVPRRLERCSECFHLLDVESEVHFFFESDLEIWMGIHGAEQTAAIHLFSARGERRGLIQLSDEAGRETWNRVVSGGIAFQD